MRLVLYSERILRKYCILKVLTGVALCNIQNQCYQQYFHLLISSNFLQFLQVFFSLQGFKSSSLRAASRDVFWQFYVFQIPSIFMVFFRKIFSVSFNLSIVLRLLKCEITQLVEKLNSELDEKVKTVLFFWRTQNEFYPPPVNFALWRPCGQTDWRLDTKLDFMTPDCHLLLPT